MELSGTVLTIIGMGVVFSALALLALTAWILERVFRVERADESVVGVESDIEAVIALTLAYHTKRKGVIHLDGVDKSMWMQETRVYQ
jgi:Na+-transporting methylmalonyl-CoA/oxaloacetate decarboxylase gamma subunit